MSAGGECRGWGQWGLRIRFKAQWEFLDRKCGMLHYTTSGPLSPGDEPMEQTVFATRLSMLRLCGTPPVRCRVVKSGIYIDRQFPVLPSSAWDVVNANWIMPVAVFCPARVATSLVRTCQEIRYVCRDPLRPPDPIQSVVRTERSEPK
ncbi:hypothetical protein QR685DRAFT_478810 [Neurospora intermedia]|uniref:Uncharacterized protein n=1 Tax=Neurospora intermedia TaxID=5142 RepID=A0ABR3D972_NEUIN